MEHPHTLDTKQLVDRIVETIDDRKGEAIKVLDLTGRGAFVDYMVIATGQSTRQVGAMADYIMRALKDVGINAHIEGVPNCEWVLIDTGDVVVHLFTPENRLFYSIEKIWSPNLV